MGLMLGVYDAPLDLGGKLLLDATPFVTSATITTGPHGDEKLDATLALPFVGAWQHYADQRARVVVVWDGSAVVWTGRLEDPGLRIGDGGNELSLAALGHSIAMSDAPYTVLWSTSNPAEFAQTTADHALAYDQSERWQRDTNGRLYFGLVKNTAYTINKPAGFLLFAPHGGRKQIAGIEFTVTMTIPTQMTLRIVGYNEGSPLASGVVHTSLAGSGALQTRDFHAVLTGNPRDIVGIDINPTASFTYAGETGANAAIITNLRVVTSLANRVNTTTTAGFAAGSNVTIPVVSTANMYVGQRLFFNFGATTETAIVASVPTATSVVVASIATTTGAGGFAVQAHKITANEIVADVLAAQRALNPLQLSSSTLEIQNPNLDLFDQAYADADGADVLNGLAVLGDSASSPNVWAWGVNRARVLSFRPASYAARTWYVDAGEVQVERSLGDLGNSVYAVYQDVSNRARRTTASTDAGSISRYALTRQRALGVQTTSATQAALHQQVQLADLANPPPRVRIVVRRLSDAAGALVPPWLPQAGDTIIIRNLPPVTGGDVDRVRAFRLTRRTVNLMSLELELEPEEPIPSMEHLLARIAARLDPA